LEACYNLVEELSGPDYKASSYGWHPESKREEMRSPDLRYILVKADKKTTAASRQDGDDDDGYGNGDEAESIQGFTSLMPTTEDNQPVIYCYEMQLRPELQGCVSILLHFPLFPGTTRIYIAMVGPSLADEELVYWLFAQGRPGTATNEPRAHGGGQYARCG
jgi:hypothetical protein